MNKSLYKKFEKPQKNNKIKKKPSKDLMIESSSKKSQKFKKSSTSKREVSSRGKSVKNPFTILVILDISTNSLIFTRLS